MACAPDATNTSGGCRALWNHVKDSSKDSARTTLAFAVDAEFRPDESVEVGLPKKCLVGKRAWAAAGL
eukprot:6199443-Pleurochrysis_carterae.AAC.2